MTQRVPKLLGSGKNISSINMDVVRAIVVSDKIRLFMANEFSPFIRGTKYRSVVDLFLVTKDWEYRLVDILEDEDPARKQYWNGRILSINRTLTNESLYSEWPPIGDWEYAPMTVDRLKRWLESERATSLLSLQDPKLICRICGHMTGQIGSHVRSHGKEYFYSYYSDYIEVGKERPTCKNPECGKPVDLISYGQGYPEYCSRSCLIRYTNKIKAVSVSPKSNSPSKSPG